MKRIISISFILIVALCSFGKNKADEAYLIKNNPAYVWGEGHASSYEDAYNNAMDNLSNKISSHVTSKSTVERRHTNENGDMSYESNLQWETQNFSHTKLNNVKSLEVSSAPDFHVIVYITQEEVAKIYAERQDKIDDMVIRALNAEKSGKIDIALQNLFQAYVLVKTLQYPTKSTLTLSSGDKVRLLTWIPDKIDEIFEGLSVDLTKVDGNEAELYFTYNGEKLKSVRFSFFNGNQWTSVHTAKDGVCTIEVNPGVNPNTLRIKYEYDYGASDELIRHAIENFDHNEIAGKSEITLCSNVKDLKQAVSKDAAKAMTEAVAENNDIGIETIKDYKPYEKVVQNLLKALDKKDYKKIKEMCSDEGWKMMDGLLKYGNAKLLSCQEYGFFELYDGRVSCRSLKMSFTFPKNKNTTFTEDVVVTFDDDKKIEGVVFGLGSEAKDIIFDRGLNAGWSQNSMLAIVDFLENYKTAFALKRLDYLESIFDDNALIISGHIVKKPVTKNDGVYANIGKEDVEFTRFSKEQYMKHLKNVFGSNEYVNIQFSDNDVIKNKPTQERYSIQVHQDYYSEHYGDTGYLFLMVDLDSPREPVIMVRYWQPERNPNINSELPKWHPDYGIITAGNFD